MPDPALFNKIKGLDAHSFPADLKRVIDGISDETLLAGADAAGLEQIIARAQLVLPKPDFAARTLAPRSGGGVLSVPYTGTTELFQVQPSSYSSRLPRAEVREERLELTYDVPGTPDAAAMTRYFDDQQTLIEQYLASLGNNVNQYNAFIAQASRARFEQRRSSLVAAHEAAKATGIPLTKK